ncbi:MAG: GTP 3',8-cyclase MoaA [Candidatus Latescibacterota bacterium]|nr:GTP 3',8-cyclase MoaA [Candidatus Latescibacterota bacterium]
MSQSLLTSSVAASPILDRLARPLGSLRVSVIDRCDLRCAYCMPEEDYAWLPKANMLTFDEIVTAVDAFVAHGVRRIRITGGEPLLRGNLVELVARLAERDGVEDLAMTTNATQLAKWAGLLREAGLQRVTVSLDSLKPARFETLTRRSALDNVLEGIHEAARLDFESLKINTVIMRDFNDDEIPDLVTFGRQIGAEMRFIEYMDVGGATLWSFDRVFSRQDILERLRKSFGPLTIQDHRGAAPAERVILPDGTRVGVIASTTQPFCGSCDRSRLTADGQWFQCLYAQDGINLRPYLRQGGERLSDFIAEVWQGRTDRGAEQRLESPDRGILYEIEELRENPHREMHTRGG